MAYYKYHIPGTNDIFFGINQAQIINELEFAVNNNLTAPNAKIEIPSKEDIEKLKKIHIHWIYPVADMSKSLEINIREDIVFEVNANAYNMVKMHLVLHKKLKDLYLIRPNHYNMVFLPEEIMKDFWNYDWRKHEDEFRKWNLELEEELSDLEMKGIFKRINNPRLN